MRLVFVRESDLDHMRLDHTGAAMAAPIFTAMQPMTEKQYFALGETAERIELFDGSIFVSPNPTIRHQRVSGRLLGILGRAAEDSGLEVLQDINLRLRPDRICIPDLVVIEPGLDGLVADAGAVRLVCEITLPSTAANDRLVKMNYYAAAGIPWYLMIEQDGGALRLYRLEANTYSLHSERGAGEALHLTEPVVASIDPNDLLRRP